MSTDDDDEDDMGSVAPEWRLRWTVFPVLLVCLVRDLVQAVASFWEGASVHTIAWHNARVQQYEDMDEARIGIESMTGMDDPEAGIEKEEEDDA